MTAFPKSPLSLWLAEYGPYQEEPPLIGDIDVDVAIVGGGFTGIATAHTLKKEQPSLSVAVLEHEVVGYGASGRNGSFAMTVVGLGFSVMAMLKGKQFVKDAHAKKPISAFRLPIMITLVPLLRCWLAGLVSRRELHRFLRHVRYQSIISALLNSEWVDSQAVCGLMSEKSSFPAIR